MNREDPAGLLAFGAPEDEYDPEVEDLIKWREAEPADQVTTVFRRWLGDELRLSASQAGGASCERGLCFGAWNITKNMTASSLIV